ncbi:M16 family metallopeptidase [Vibrio coralliilyticus]|uniref:M16 family metallopeptidase n=1 Tax=Vibrio coralliilyticus TaxID=190893 RepID=UPI00148B5164|nr:M16 family metallopeptidase [Vibrio coralliilyticus]NOI28092.1 insulinase family protein [Vibrio coralliilyticus]NOI49447.1 insulinase family protein [Vibrio coralliilyticus]
MKKVLIWFVLLLTGCAQQSASIPIQQDTNWTSGQLDNGLRYHIYPIDTEAISLRLFVHAGSLEETTDQLGYAHFVEHMAFNGSKNFTPNEVIELMEKTGASGHDVNAYTSYEETVYTLSLPNQDELDKAMLWLRDVANRVTFAPDEVEREKGVVLAEYRRGVPEHLSFYDKVYENSVKGTPYEGKDAIGTPETIQNATSQSLKAFYDTWYQPQSSELIIVGDVKRKDAKALVEKMFADWQPTSDLPPPVRSKAEINKGDFVAQVGIDEPSVTGLTFYLGNDVLLTREDRIEYWKDNIVARLISHRLDAVYSEHALPLRGFDSSIYTSVNERVYDASIAFSFQDRDTVQPLFLKTLASIRDHGVSQEELDVVMAEYRSSREHADDDWFQRGAEDFAEDKTFQLAEGEPSQSLADYKRSLDQLLRTADIEDINQHARSMLSYSYDVFVGTDRTESVEQVKQTLPEWKSMYGMPGVASNRISTDVDGLIEVESINPLPDATNGKNGEVIWSLDNGIDVLFDPENDSDFAHIVYMSAGGKAVLDRELLPASQLLLAMIIKSGVGQFNGTQLKSYVRKNNIDVQSYINGSEHGFEISVPKEQVNDALKLLYNLMVYPKFSEQQLEVLKKEYSDELLSYLRSPLGQWYDAIETNTFTPQSVYFPTYAHDFENVTVDQVQQAYDELFRKSRNSKLVIVAGLESSQVVHGVKNYVSTIPLEAATMPSYQVNYNERPDSKVNLAINNEQNSRYTLRAINKSARPQDAKLVLVDKVIQRILARRLDAYVREELSLDYAPDNFYSTDHNEPATDWTLEAQVAAEDLPKVEQAIDKVIQELIAAVTQEELTIAKEQLDVYLEDTINYPSDVAWFRALTLVNGFGEEAFTQAREVAKTITLDDVRVRIVESFGQSAEKYKYILSPLDQ